MLHRLMEGLPAQLKLYYLCLLTDWPLQSLAYLARWERWGRSKKSEKQQEGLHLLLKAQTVVSRRVSAYLLYPSAFILAKITQGHVLLVHTCSLLLYKYAVFMNLIHFYPSQMNIFSPIFRHLYCDNCKKEWWLVTPKKLLSSALILANITNCHAYLRSFDLLFSPHHCRWAFWGNYHSYVQCKYQPGFSMLFLLPLF